ncbi:phage tail protein [Lysinibacillus louembei]|uniref:Phage tail protein n=1 Tax=Lysinibacillus louembei TaxID=1470088 RepID=A0ABZ0RT66_9BACI|nr:phage tail protein [Lysinibacillus louembei]WPK10604.1 phage tail protein [Lysinibacillus louembei]
MTQYGTLITNIGLAKIANAQVTQQKVGLQYIALGDGNGSHYVPTQSQSALVNEVWRGPVANVTIDSMNDNRIIIDSVIPSDVGGFTIREIGIFDEENQLIALGQYPEKYKPQLNEGITEETLIHFVIETNNADAVELSIDPTIIVASRKYVDERVATVSTNLMELEEDFTAHKGNFNKEILMQHKFYVDGATGSDAIGDGTEDKPFKTLKKAMDVLQNKTSAKGVEIRIKPGVYRENIFLEADVSLRLTACDGEVFIIHESTSVNDNNNVTMMFWRLRSLYFHQENGGSFQILIDPKGMNSRALDIRYVPEVAVGSLATVGGVVGADISKVVALKTDNSTANISIKFVNSDIVISNGFGSTLVNSGITFTNCNRIINERGAIFSNALGDAYIGVPVYNMNNAGMYLNYVNNGIIIESGENANGRYIKFADGTLICITNNLQCPSVNTQIPNSGLYRSDSLSWTFPAVFINVASIAMRVTMGASSSWATIGGQATTAYSASYQIYSSIPYPANSQVSGIAIGRWK